MTRILSLVAPTLIMALSAQGTAKAQEYPSRPIHIVVGYPPGAGVDFTARLFAERLQTALGQPTVVENRAGAAGEIAAEYVSRAKPDGYTLMYAVGSDLEWTKFLTKRPTIDPLKDLTPLATVISSVNCIAVNAASPFKTFSELIELARQNPGKLTYGTSGTQSYYYLIGQTLKQQSVDMLHVPYKGNAPVVRALLGREINVALTTLGSVIPDVANGSVRILAVMQPQRFAGTPDIPTIAETLPNFRAPLSWFGFFGPPGLPRPIIDRLSTEIGTAARSPEIEQKIKSLDLNVFWTPSNEMHPLITDSTETFRRLIEAMGIKPAD